MTKKLNLIGLKGHLNHRADGVGIAIEVANIIADADKFLPTAYQFIGCDCVDVARLNLGGYPVDVWVDDNGLLNQADPHLGGLLGWLIVDDDGNQIPLAGALVFASCNDEGETVDCPPIDIGALMEQERITPISIPEASFH